MSKKVLIVSILSSLFFLAACGSNNQQIKVDDNWVSTPNASVNDKGVKVNNVQIKNTVDENSLTEDEKEALKVMEQLLND